VKVDDMKADDDVALRAWEREQPDAITKDPLWTLNCYRESLFLVDLAREDLEKSAQNALLAEAKGQLLTSVTSVAANIAEGYGRLTAPDRAKFLSYALGSAREAMTWYRALAPSSRDPRIADRIERLARVRRMLIGLLKRPSQSGGRKFDPW
jgi:four helix bundle protein